MKQKVIVIGAGPAGLTAAYELLKSEQDFEVVILEETKDIGGISKTVNYKGNRMDMGGHRFFSKVPEVNDWWEKMMPIQGALPIDDRILGREMTIIEGGADPEKTDRVMLRRHRVSRIFFMDKFFDYPISMKKETFFNMGLKNSIACGVSYLGSMIHKLPETNLENFYINRFGKKLYTMFFEYYTENLWGRHPREIDASWGNQRVKGLSVTAVIKDVLGKILKDKNREVETSLIEEFSYPKLGPGQLWEITANEINKMGGNIYLDACVKAIYKNNHNEITGVEYQQGGVRYSMNADIVISSMALKDLVCGMNDIPNDIFRIANGLPYRDYMTVGVLVDKLKLKNQTKRRTIGDIVPDCWVYVQEKSVKMGRFQIYNNWSPYMVADLEHTVWMGLEYFVQEGDEFWKMNDKKFSDMAVNEMIRLGLIDSVKNVIDTHVERVKKAYPAYFDTYDEIDTLVEYLKQIPNLYCVGRNGQHRYNNIDHSMCTSFEAVRNILTGKKDKDNVWSVNTEKKYHESK